jgi:hypothetical protein
LYCCLLLLELKTSEYLRLVVVRHHSGETKPQENLCLLSHIRLLRLPRRLRFTAQKRKYRNSSWRLSSLDQLSCAAQQCLPVVGSVTVHEKLSPIGKFAFCVFGGFCVLPPRSVNGAISCRRVSRLRQPSYGTPQRLSVAGSATVHEKPDAVGKCAFCGLGGFCVLPPRSVNGAISCRRVSRLRQPSYGTPQRLSAASSVIVNEQPRRSGKIVFCVFVCFCMLPPRSENSATVPADCQT